MRGIRGLFACAISAGCLLLALALASADEMPADPHAHHRMMQMPPVEARSVDHYVVPDVTLVRSDGARVKLAQELNDGRPVLLDFIYTTCTTICPVMSQIFAEVQTRLGHDAYKVKMVSISIDPEEDTPARLNEYSKRYHPGAQWTFLTGTVEASVSAQRAFDAYRGDKMNHVPVTFFRRAPGQPWVRLDGFATPNVVLRELHTQGAQQ
jgi:protein SCO1